MQYNALEKLSESFSAGNIPVRYTDYNNYPHSNEFRAKQTVPDKLVANCVESLIGVCVYVRAVYLVAFRLNILKNVYIAAPRHRFRFQCARYARDCTEDIY